MLHIPYYLLRLSYLPFSIGVCAGLWWFFLVCHVPIVFFSISLYLVCRIDTGALTSVYDVDEEPKNIVLRAFLMVVWD